MIKTNSGLRDVTCNENNRHCNMGRTPHLFLPCSLGTYIFLGCLYSGRRQKANTKNQKHRPNTGYNACRQNMVTRISCYRWVGLIAITIVTILFGTSLRPIYYVLKNFHRKFPKLVVPPTDGTAKCLVRCIVLVP